MDTKNSRNNEETHLILRLQLGALGFNGTAPHSAPMAHASSSLGSLSPIDPENLGLEFVCEEIWVVVRVLSLGARERARVQREFRESVLSVEGKRDWKLMLTQFNWNYKIAFHNFENYNYALDLNFVFYIVLMHMNKIMKLKKV